MSKNQQEPKMQLEEEVAFIFRTVFQRTVQIKPKAFQQIKEAMKKNAQELVTEALKRAVRREASLNTLEVADLLWAIDRRGQKYRLKIGKTLATASVFSDFGEKKFMVNYNDDEADQADDVEEK